MQIIYIEDTGYPPINICMYIYYTSMGRSPTHLGGSNPSNGATEAAPAGGSNSPPLDTEWCPWPWIWRRAERRKHKRPKDFGQIQRQYSLVRRSSGECLNFSAVMTKERLHLVSSGRTQHPPTTHRTLSSTHQTPTASDGQKRSECSEVRSPCWARFAC